MESKGLHINSFHRNQRLLDAINLLLISYKLSAKGIRAREGDEKLTEAKGVIVFFLDELGTLVGKVERREEEPLIGADIRLRSFAKSFVEAKGRVAKFKSPLFKSEFSKVRAMLKGEVAEDVPGLVDSLSELRILLEEQINIDSKSIINDI